jgi:hypothetical protein
MTRAGVPNSPWRFGSSPAQRISVKAGDGKGRRGGVTGKGFVKGQVNNPRGRPKDLIGFRERCRERTLEIVEVMEHVFFQGTWPPSPKQKPHQLSDAVRIQAGVLLVANGWGTPPNSTEIKINLPQTDAIKQINKDMTPEQAMDAYMRTVAADSQPRLEHTSDEPATIDGDFVDVTPKPEDGE